MRAPTFALVLYGAVTAATAAITVSPMCRVEPLQVPIDGTRDCAATVRGIDLLRTPDVSAPPANSIIQLRREEDMSVIVSTDRAELVVDDALTRLHGDALVVEITDMHAFACVVPVRFFVPAGAAVSRCAEFKWPIPADYTADCAQPRSARPAHASSSGLQDANAANTYTLHGPALSTVVQTNMHIATISARWTLFNSMLPPPESRKENVLTAMRRRLTCSTTPDAEQGPVYVVARRGAQFYSAATPDMTAPTAGAPLNACSRLAGVPPATDVAGRWMHLNTHIGVSERTRNWTHVQMVRERLAGGLTAQLVAGSVACTRSAQHVNVSVRVAVDSACQYAFALDSVVSAALRLNPGAHDADSTWHVCRNTAYDDAAATIQFNCTGIAARDMPSQDITTTLRLIYAGNSLDTLAEVTVLWSANSCAHVEEAIAPARSSPRRVDLRQLGMAKHPGALAHIDL